MSLLQKGWSIRRYFVYSGRVSSYYIGYTGMNGKGIRYSFHVKNGKKTNFVKEINTISSQKADMIEHEERKRVFR